MRRFPLPFRALFFLIAPAALASPAVADEKTPAPQAEDAAPAPLTPGDHRRELTAGGRARSYLVHVPPKYDATRPTPVVLAFHGAMMNARMMVSFSALSDKADEAGFVVVYPNGTGLGEAALFWNAGAEPKADGRPPDDVAFVAALLDDLATVVNVDAKRVYAAGMSNGGMMCHRLAAELSDRIAAVAPVTGTLALPAKRVRPKRAVPVIHFHGTADTMVPFEGPRGGPRRGTAVTLEFLSVAKTIDAWVEANGCPAEPAVNDLPDKADDGTTVTRTVYGPGRDGAEVVLVTVTGGGHTWPGQPPPVKFLGKSTADVSANDLLWEFFERHPMK